MAPLGTLRNTFTDGDLGLEGKRAAQGTRFFCPVLVLVPSWGPDGRLGIFSPGPQFDRAYCFFAICKKFQFCRMFAILREMRPKSPLPNQTGTLVSRLLPWAAAHCAGPCPPDRSPGAPSLGEELEVSPPPPAPRVPPNNKHHFFFPPYPSSPRPHSQGLTRGGKGQQRFVFV